MSQDILIRVQGVNKQFDLGKTVVYALRNINLEIFRGEYLSIMGPSGSGKSTLFNMIGALDRPTSGEVEVAGVYLTRLSPRQLAHFRGNHIGYVFQSYNLLPAYDAVQNVCLPLLFSGISPLEAEKRAQEVLTRVGLGHRLTHRPDEMSGGQQQRVAIARALANDPVMLLADEPTGNLDSATGREIMEMLGALNAQGKTIIMVTHEPDIANIAGHRLVMRDGVIESAGKGRL